MKMKKLPENTGIGKSLLPKNSNIKEEYIKYILANKSTLQFSYEFNYDKNNIPVFIIGKDIEKELPLVRFPIVVTTNNVNYIVTNLVGGVKSDVSRSLIDSKRTDYVDFEAVRNILIYQTIAEKDTSYLVTLTAQLATAVITKIVSQHLRLDTFNTIDLEGAVFYYLLTRYGTFSDDSIKTKMLNMLSIGYRNNSNAVNIIIDKLSKVDKDSNLSTFINTVANSATLAQIDNSAILAMISNIWFSGSENSSMHLYMAIEDFHTMTSILYHSINTPTGKKTLLAKIINDNKRSLRIDQFNSTIDGLIKDNTM